MPQGPINFLDIRNILHDFLRNHRGVGYRTMQPCPHGQAFVRFNYLFDRDNLIQNSPHQYGNGTISFYAHNRAWNNRTAILTHEAWLMLLDVVLPAVEEVLHAQAEEIDVVQDAPFNPGHVLAMDDFTDSSDEEILPPPVPAAAPEVFVPNLQNLQNFIVDEVPLEDLIAFDDLQPQNDFHWLIQF